MSSKTRSGLALSAFFAACLVAGAAVMHMIQPVDYAAAADDPVPGPGPAVAMLFDAGVDQVVDVDAGPVATAPAAPISRAPTPAVSSASTPEEVADAAWWALRAGYLGPALLLGVFAAGAHLQRRRGYVIKRWPKLNDGRVWAVVSIITVAAGTLIPLAIANALTVHAIYGALLGSLLLFVKSHLGWSEPATSTATAT